MGPMLDAAVGIATQVYRAVHVDAHLAPDFRSDRADVVVDGAGRKLATGPVECQYVMPGEGGDDLLEAVAVQVGHRHVLVEQARAGTGIAQVARRPAWTNATVGLEDVYLGRGGGTGTTHDDLKLAVIFQVFHRQCADLSATERVSCPDHVAEAVIDGELIGAAADDHLRRSVTREVCHGDARPDAVGARGAPLEAAVGAVQGHDVVSAPDDFRLAVAVEIGDGRRGVPAGVTPWPGQAAAVLPF